MVAKSVPASKEEGTLPCSFFFVCLFVFLGLKLAFLHVSLEKVQYLNCGLPQALGKLCTEYQLRMK